MKDSQKNDRATWMFVSKQNLDVSFVRRFYIFYEQTWRFRRKASRHRPHAGKEPYWDRGRKRKNDRLMFNAIPWIMKTGAPRRDLYPEFSREYGA